MLADRFLPHYHISEVHRISIAATPERIFPLVNEMDFSESRIIRILFTLRGLGSKKHLLKKMFVELDSIAEKEVAYGLAGQFWKSRGNLQVMTPPGFQSFSTPGFLKAVWTFELSPENSGRTILITETRVECLGSTARRLFSIYWFFIRPFSGIIRMEMLRAVRNKAERSLTESLAT
jgi:hypothetical protein